MIDGVGDKRIFNNFGSLVFFLILIEVNRVKYFIIVFSVFLCVCVYVCFIKGKEICIYV